MIRIEVKDHGVTQALKKAPSAVAANLGFAAHRAALETARKMKALAPKAFSTLTNSINATKINSLTYRAGPNVSYADAVEKGTGPGGSPPVFALLKWIQVKGISPRDASMTELDLAWAIKRKIQQQGTPAQPFAEPVASSGFPQQRLKVLVDQAVAKGLTQAGF